MINYYKLLEIPDFSDAQSVKQAYRKKVKTYHPDVNPGAESEDIMKWMNKAYQTLSDPASKLMYDRSLRQSYNQVTEKIRTKPSVQDMVAYAEKVRQSEKRSYEISNQKFPFFYRYSLSALLCLSGLYIVWSEWFIDENSLGYVLLILGFLMFIIGAQFLLQLSYKQMRVFSFNQKGFIRNYESISVYGFILLLIIGPIFTIWAAHLRKSFHETHYKTYTVADIEYMNQDYITYKFETASKTLISKKQSIQQGKPVLVDDYKVLVWFSTKEPRIAEIVYQSLDSPTK